jgi:hypothetical protein
MTKVLLEQSSKQIIENDELLRAWIKPGLQVYLR